MLYSYFSTDKNEILSLGEALVKLSINEQYLCKLSDFRKDLQVRLQLKAHCHEFDSLDLHINLQ